MAQEPKRLPTPGVVSTPEAGEFHLQSVIYKVISSHCNPAVENDVELQLWGHKTGHSLVLVLVPDPEGGPKAEQAKQMTKNKMDDKKNSHSVAEEQLVLMEPLLSHHRIPDL